MSEIISKSNITIDGVITANSLITSGGTSSQFVKGDGTLDPSTYLLNITGESLSSLSDVTITTIAAGELLKWDGLGWINNTLAEANIEEAFSKNTAFNKNFGTLAGTVAEGNDSRILNGQTAFTWGNHAGLYVGLTGNETVGGLKTFTNSIYTGGNIRIQTTGNKLEFGNANVAIRRISNNLELGGYDKIIFKSSNTTIDSQIERMRIDSSGNVGIGTTSPSARLQVVTADGDVSSIRVGRADNSNYWDINHAGNDFRLYNTAGIGSDILLGVNSGGVDQGNKLGVGTASPSYKLDVNGDARLNGVTFVASGASRNISTHSSAGRLLLNGGTSSSNGAYIEIAGDSYSTGDFVNIIAGKTYISGNVGIGTTTPSQKLDVAGNISVYNSYAAGASLFLNHSNQYSSSIIKSIADTIDGQDSGSSMLRFYTNDNSTTSPTVALDLTSESNAIFYGKVGIGTINPGTKLDVSGVITATGGTSTEWNTAYGWGDHSTQNYARTDVAETFTNNVTIQGNLTVSGTTTTINTETVNIADNMILLNSNETLAPTQDAGLEIERGTSVNTKFYWNEALDDWYLNTDGTSAKLVFHSGNFTDNSSNWDTAFGWGDHSGLYLPIGTVIPTQYTDEMAQDALGNIFSVTATIEPVYNDGLPTFEWSVRNGSIGSTQLSTSVNNNIANGVTAFGWGDHAGLYLPIATQLAQTKASVANQFLNSYNATTGLFTSKQVAYSGLSGIPSTFTPSPHTLDSHSNVTITSNTSGELLKWNGSAWINNTLAEAGIMSSTKQLAVTKALITNQVLNSYNATTGVFTSIQPTFASLASKPTTIAGYGITDFNSLGDARWLGISATAANSTLFNSLNSGQFLRSDVADTKTKGDLTFNDNVKLQLGTDNDFKMFHDGADARAQWITGNLVFQDNLTTRFMFERTTGNFTNTGTITSEGVGDSKFSGSLLVGAGEPSPACAFHVVDEVNLLGGITGDSQEFRRLQYRGGSGGNDIKISEYALRDATGTSWTTSRYHNSIGIDNVFKTPGVDTKVFWERDPYSGFHYFGNAANYVLTVDGVGNNVGIGTTSPSYRLDVSGDGRFTSSLTANSFIKIGGTASQFLKADGSVDTNTYITSLPSTSFATLSLDMTDISSGLVKYKKINGRLILNGGFTVTSTGLINVGTLPVGFRPSRFRTLVIITGGSAGQLSIQTDGSITADTDSITEYNIDIEITLDIED